MKIQNKTFVVTGAGGGIGSELALQLLAIGARVAAVDLSQDNLEKLREKAGDNATNLSIHTLDITDREAVAALPEQVAATHGQVDGLINCAGIIQPFVKIADLDYTAIERVMNVNFYGTVSMTKAFLPLLSARPEATITNVSSMGGFLPVPGQSVYGASKAAVKLFTEGLFAEMQGTNVHVSAVFPGATATEITKNSGVAMLSDQSVDSSKFKMLPASDAAAIIIRGVEKNKPLIYTGSDSKIMNRLYRLAPTFATKLIAKQMRSLLK